MTNYIVVRGCTSRLVVSGVPGFATYDVRVEHSANSHPGKMLRVQHTTGIRKHGCACRGSEHVGHVGCWVGGLKAWRSGKH